MSNPTYNAVHVSVPLTDLSVAYFEANRDKYAAMRIFPAVAVTKQADKYYTYNRGDLLRTEAKYRGPGAEAAVGNYKVSTDSYFCDPIAIAKDTADAVRANADPQFDLDGEAAEYVTDQIMRKMDKDWLTDFFATGKWDGASSSTDMTGTSSAPSTSTQVLQWNDVASVPIEDIHGEINAVEAGSGYRPNVLALGPEVKRHLVDHPDIIDRIKYTQRGIVDDALLAALFGVEEVITLRAVENSGSEGAADSHAFMAGKHALLLYRPPSPGLRTPSAGYTFTWTAMGAPVGGVRVSRYRLDRNASDRIEGEAWFDHKQVASDLGAFFASVVA